MTRESCRYCGSGGCKRAVIADLVTVEPDGRRGEPVPLCGRATVALQASFRAHGNINAAGQMLAVRYRDGGMIR